jgi:glyceraldehyde 3-phosphate dehydrogenase
MPIKIGINGFGRIGRVFYRASLKDDEFNKNFEVIAVNDITDSRTLAHLLKYDSVHGVLDKEISWTESSIKIEDEEIKVLSERDPASLPWSSLGAEIVLESTGLFRDRDNANKHIKAGANKVIVSAPAKDPDVTIVLGVNQEVYDKNKHNIISMASCTTNCLAPMVKVLHDNFGVNRGLMTTIHAYTNDQRMLDLPHKDLRRARAGAVSIIPTTTGAAKAIGLIIPELQGKLNGLSLRVPVPDGSVTDLTAELKNPADFQEINNAYKKASEGELKGILQYTEDPIVSSDIIGNPNSCILDGPNTTILSGQLQWAKIFGWYDNEWGFSSRLVDLFKFIAKNQ